MGSENSQLADRPMAIALFDKETFAGASEHKGGDNRFVELNKQLDKLKDLQAGWDSYDAEPPNGVSIEHLKTTHAPGSNVP
jgi:hypothetical protein